MRLSNKDLNKKGIEKKTFEATKSILIDDGSVDVILRQAGVINNG